MSNNWTKVPMNEARQELRQLAKSLNWELKHLTAAVNGVRDLLYEEGREIRREGRAQRGGTEEERSGRVPRIFGTFHKKGARLRRDGVN